MMKKQKQQQLLSHNQHQIEYVFADACGNTFLIFDCLPNMLTDQEWVDLKEKIWTTLGQAHVDDALVLRKLEEKGHTIKLKMHVLEPDRTEADFCGNGARAVGLYLCNKYGTGLRFFLMSLRGIHGFRYDNNECLVEMGKPRLSSEKLIFNFHQKDYSFRFVDCVEPHLVTDDFFDREVLLEIGRQINHKWKKRFPRGVNVNCLRYLDSQLLEVLTYERGVYSITKACGTGSLACTKVAIDQRHIIPNVNVTIKVLGGELYIYQLNDGFWLGGSVILA